MTDSDIILFSVVGVLAFNIFIARSKQWQGRIWPFLLMQMLNIGAGVFMVLHGIPDFNEELDIVNIMIGLLFFFHVILNNNRWQRYKHSIRKAPTDTEIDKSMITGP